MWLLQVIVREWHQQEERLVKISEDEVFVYILSPLLAMLILGLLATNIISFLNYRVFLDMYPQSLVKYPLY